MKKFISITLAFTTTLWLAGSFIFVPVAKAAIIDGDIVSADAAFLDADGNTYQAYDVFIVKIIGTKTFKRLILNPQVFTSYGHLKWSNLKKISAATVAGYTTSSLVRVINDEKVYKLAPDGDTGTKQWVDDLACFTSKGYDWDSVYIINAVDGGNYTTGSSICGTTAAGDLTLSLASNSPSASTLPKNAYGVTFAKIKVAGTGKITQIVLKRSGAGSVDDFDNVYLYENGKRLTAGRSVSSATSKVTFISLAINAPTTIDIVADLSATAGNQDYFTIESASDVTANATVGGSFPINGAPMSMSGSDGGTLTVERSGSTAYNVTIGSKEAEISAFKVTASTEGTKINRVQLYNSGTVTSTKLTNLKLKVGDTTLATADTLSSDGYVVFNLATPKEILKGSNVIFYVYADVGGKPDETIKLYLELASDITGIGTTFGFGMQATITSYDSDTLITATLKGGDLTLVKSGPNATNVGTTTDDTIFLELTMSAAADITISRTRLAWCVDQAGEGTYDAADTNFTDIEDTKIVNKDTGVVLAGPHDGSAFVTQATYCPGTINGLYKDYTDNFDISAGQSINIKVIADIKTANDADDSASELGATDKIKIIWYSYSSLVGTSGTSTYMKYTGTTNAVDDSAIVPSSDIAGEEMTIAAPSLTVTLAGSPAGDITAAETVGTARTFVSGQTAVSVVGLVFTAGSASDVKVTALSLTGYVNCNDAATAFTAGLQDSNCYVKNLVSSVEIWDTTANAVVPGSLAKGFSGTSFQTVQYTGLSWTIPAGEARTLLVKGNLSSNIPSTTLDAISFDIATAATDITSQDKDANDITETTDAVNGGINPGVSIAIYPYGSITVAKANDTPDQSVMVMGSTNNETSKVKLTGARESLLIEKFSLDITEDLASRSNFSGVALKYQTQAQYGTSTWTTSTKKTFGATATIAFNFTGTDRPYVPKDDSSYVTVLADIVGYEAGTGAKDGDYTYFAPATDTNEIKAYGAQSGHLFTSATEPTQTDFAYHYIFRSKPFFEKVAWSGDELELARFSITAVGYDVTFDGTSSDGMFISVVNTTAEVWTQEGVTSAALEFDVIASGTDNTVQTLYLYDWNNNIVSSVTNMTLSHADAVTELLSSAGSGCSVADGSTLEACVTSISFMFEEYSSAVIVPQGTTKTFYVLLDNTVDFDHTDEYLYLKFKQDEGVAAADSNFDNCSIVWYDGTDDEQTRTVLEHRICMPANTKNIGAFPTTFRTLRGTTTP